jgi:beta-glucosidase
MVMSEFEKATDVILAEYGVEQSVLFEILFGDREATGKLPYNMPKDMETVERHCEDLPDDYEPYTDSMGNTYRRGYRLK